MRPVTHGDIAATARVLMVTPQDARPEVLRAIITDAQRADRYRRLWSRVHPALGNGTLMAAALRHDPGPEPAAGDPAYLAAMLMVIETLLDLHTHRCPP
ncbi:hypothetical protein HUK65_03060 [Rhodobacteraceae bacterium 2376]|uniref:DUF7742 domain-containing protein n=1 Tax=Rhabdonatronobacter sediminivivens TaxID=2743469 RepID=A0A7Z0HX72_9RHOB|nr:hypothetical protein [Rhabdonatronobacter sediminivivens]NYS23958.1 hypothetical protein [Rhabdonatronobacter sediminivivens]